MNINKKTNKIKDEIKKLESVGSNISDKLKSTRDSAFTRFPLIFLLLSTFGLVATFYGFEKFIDQIPFFINNPHMVLLTGVVTLLATGALYKKLS